MNTWQANWLEETYDEIDNELKLRKIKLSDQKDRLRWGYTTKGLFTTKEAYQILYQPLQIIKDPLWDQFWQPNIWPKVSTFLWLLSKQRILTWDNLQKCGFIGPSRCSNYDLHSENIKHFLDTCPLVAQM